MPARAWRLIIDGPVPGAMNMALDRAVLACREAGESPPTLRLYRWEVPTVTLGRFQPIEQVDLDACVRRGFDVVRRPTGGRGVLHDDELTYSIVAATEDGVPRGVAASYRHLSAALAEAYRRLGVGAELTARQRGVRGAGACYLHATQADLSVGAAKLSGSAQVWKDDAVLQHGSFVVTRDVAAESEVFFLGPEASGELGRATQTLCGALGRRVELAEIEEAVVQAAREVFGVVVEPGAFSARELQLAGEWAVEHQISTARRKM
jgi:lipoyl(octanoyl) transferase